MGGADAAMAPPSLTNNNTGMLPPPAMPGAFDNGQTTPQMLAANALPASPAAPAAPPTGALGASPAAPPADAGALGEASVDQSPSGAPAITFKDMLSGATREHKETALKNLEKHVNVDDEFSALQEHGIVPADAKMSRHEKGMLVLEFGLRMMAAAAQGADAMGAAGIAGQGLLESYRATKDADKKEATRQSERAQDRGDRLAENATRSNEHIMEGNQRQAISYQEQAGADRRNQSDNATRMDVARLEAKTRLAEARDRARAEKQPMHFVDANGDLKLVDAEGKVTTPTEDTTDASGKKTKKTIKPLQKNDSSGIDPDKVQGLIEQEKKSLAADPKFQKDIRQRKLSAADADAYLETQARKNVQGRLPVDPKSADPFGMLN
jgi:hypothetical protein